MLTSRLTVDTSRHVPSAPVSFGNPSAHPGSARRCELPSKLEVIIAFSSTLMAGKYYSGPRSMCLHTAPMPIVSALLYPDTGNLQLNSSFVSVLIMHHSVSRNSHIICITTSLIITGLLSEIKGSPSGR